MTAPMLVPTPPAPEPPSQKRGLRSRFAAALLAVVALAAAGCGDDDGDGEEAEVLTPAEAMDRAGPATVQGFLWSEIRDEEQITFLCETVLESFPPQCGEPSISVTGLDLVEVGGMQFDENVFWAEGVRLRGELAKGMLTSSSVELNAYDPQLELSMRVEVQGELTHGPVAWVIWVTNTGRTRSDLLFPTSQRADVVLVSEGVERHRWSTDRIFTQAEEEETLLSGESRRLVLEDVLAVGPGEYRLEAVLTSDKEPGPAVGSVAVSD